MSTHAKCWVMRCALMALVTGLPAAAVAQDAAAVQELAPGPLGLPPPPAQLAAGEEWTFSSSSRFGDRPDVEFTVSMPTAEASSEDLWSGLTNMFRRLYELITIYEVTPDQEIYEGITDLTAIYAATQDQYETVCGMADESQHVEDYNGALGAPVDFVALRQRSTGQIRWNVNLDTQFEPPHSPGEVAGRRWCSGTLLPDDLFLTAAHCFQPNINGWPTPERFDGRRLVRLEAEELAGLMHVNFNYQKIAGQQQIRQPDTFPIVELVEYGFGRLAGLDYAVVRLGRDRQGRRAGDLYQEAEIDIRPQALRDRTRLTIVQHPNGSPKMVNAGPLSQHDSVWIWYANLDTRSGSSGAGILSEEGRVIGVHTNGGCTATGGANRGVSLEAVAAQSDIF